MNILLFKENTNTIYSSSTEYDHIKKILKLKKNDSFKYGVYNGDIYTATIESFDDNKIYFTSKLHTEKDVAAFLYPITVVLASVRPICLKRMVRELASIGVAKIIIVNGELSEKSYKNSKLYQKDKLEELVLQGAIQSGRTGITDIIYSDSLADVMKKNNNKGLYFCDNKIKSEHILETTFEYPLLIAIGSERGWSDKERDIFRKNNFKSISLGSRILRSETASVFAASTVVGRYHVTHNCEK